MSFFMIVSSASIYAELLGGTATFSGLIIGIPPAISGLSLLFISRYDGGMLLHLPPLYNNQPLTEQL
ncbi:hypothetical protein CPB84DRAFT_1783390, partial [Gymnopilus junonius]